MLEKGRVASLAGDLAVVQFERSSSCKNCGACLRAGDTEMVVEVRNTLGAKVGDGVSVELEERSFFSAALLMYGVPLLALVASLAVAIALGASELLSIGISIAAAVLAFGLLRLLEPTFKRSSRFSVKMVELFKAS